MSTIHLVAEEDRLKVLPKYFGVQMTRFESYAFHFGGELIPEYDGGYWDFFETSDGAFIMAPIMQSGLGKLVHMESPNGYSCDVPYVIAGIIVTIFALSHLAITMYHENEPNEHVVKMCDKLKYFADESEYGRQIFGMID